MVLEAIIFLNTSTLRTHVSQPVKLAAVTVAVLLSFNSRAISPKPIISVSDESSFTNYTFWDRLGSNALVPGT